MASRCCRSEKSKFFGVPRGRRSEDQTLISGWEESGSRDCRPPVFFGKLNSCPLMWGAGRFDPVGFDEKAGVPCGNVGSRQCSSSPGAKADIDLVLGAGGSDPAVCLDASSMLDACCKVFCSGGDPRCSIRNFLFFSISSQPDCQETGLGLSGMWHRV